MCTAIQPERQAKNVKKTVKEVKRKKRLWCNQNNFVKRFFSIYE